MKFVAYRLHEEDDRMLAERVREQARELNMQPLAVGARSPYRVSHRWKLTTHNTVNGERFEYELQRYNQDGEHPYGRRKANSLWTIPVHNK